MSTKKAKKIWLMIMSIFVLVLSGCNKQSRLKVGINTEGPKYSPYSSIFEVTDINIDRYETGTNEYYYFVVMRDLSKVNLEQLSNEDLNYKMVFDDSTIWPTILPAGFNPQLMLEEGKGTTFGVNQFHNNNITGKGVGIAIIGGPLYLEHVEYKENIKLYQSFFEDTEYNDYGDFEASIMVSNLVGNSVGFAPDATIYYLANMIYDPNGEPDLNRFAENIDMLVELNQTLKEDKIKLIIIPLGLNETLKGYDNFIKAIKNAERTGIYVLVGVEGNELLSFSKLSKEPYQPVGDKNSYVIDERYEQYHKAFDTLLIPTGGRVFASPLISDKPSYIYIPSIFAGYGEMTTSIGGLYALALEIRPRLKFEEFMVILRRSTTTIEAVGDREEITNVIDPGKLYEELMKLKDR